MLHTRGLSVLAVLLLPTFSETVFDVPKLAIATNPDWWKNGVFYHICPKSFQDSNTDGIENLNRITNKLDDLKEAGITGIWISPTYVSGGIDQGYDISDFENINPEYGTVTDFQKLIYEAHARDIQIILDFVPNYSGNQVDTCLENKAKRFDDSDVYGKDEESNLKPFGFPRFQDWESSNKKKQYYLRQFAEQLPDSNYQNLQLKEAMKDVLKFWLDMGVNGFRVDAVPFRYEDDQSRDEPPLDCKGTMIFA